jgi:hypothetical protein
MSVLPYHFKGTSCLKCPFVFTSEWGPPTCNMHYMTNGGVKKTPWASECGGVPLDCPLKTNEKIEVKLV